ncbi:flagellar biosynthetic protein FliO [Chitinilyticum litopenaei]|uniref:flagellar biosynthetic protein FliO n=1 Tax=Chitinilyticum litopenaei TaxID=1121276 RepID=UPI000416A541|nr:flagellar biosynthetic protein FliO [Chitinilyticum litopenaei]
MPRIIPLLAGLLLPCAPVLAAAASGIPAATAGSGLAALAQVALALIVVLGLIVVGAWLMRRFSLLPRAAGGQLRVVSGVMVGTRERVVIVELRDTWLVLGVTGEQVNLLHTLPRPADAPDAAAAMPPFAQWLQQAIARRNASAATESSDAR